MTAHASDIDINADLGEGFPNDEKLLELVTSTSLSCGAHAGEPSSIRQTLDWAASRGVAVGAHPGYPDRAHFGRRERVITASEVGRLILDQFSFLEKLTSSTGIPIRFLKPHGALYNQAQRDPEIAQGVVDAAKQLDLPVLGQPGTLLERLADETGLHFIAEGFPDRRYERDGRLVPRSRPDAVLEDFTEIETQVIRLVHAGLDTLCIHGDASSAVSNAAKVREILNNNGIVPKFWG